jgi:hypothetical protein
MFFLTTKDVWEAIKDTYSDTENSSAKIFNKIIKLFKELFNMLITPLNFVYSFPSPIIPELAISKMNKKMFRKSV